MESCFDGKLIGILGYLLCKSFGDGLLGFFNLKLDEATPGIHAARQHATLTDAIDQLTLAKAASAFNSQNGIDIAR